MKAQAYFAWALVSRIGQPNLLLPCRSGFSISAARSRLCHSCLLEKYTKHEILTTQESVRINIDIDDGLMREAMRTSGAATKKVHNRGWPPVARSNVLAEYNSQAAR